MKTGSAPNEDGGRPPDEAKSPHSHFSYLIAKGLTVKATAPFCTSIIAADRGIAKNHDFKRLCGQILRYLL